MSTSTIVLTCIHFLNMVAIITIIFFQRKDSSTRFAWIMILAFVPVLGFFLYLLFGHNYARKGRTAFSVAGAREIRGYVEEQLANAGRLNIADTRYVRLARMNLLNDGAVLTGDNAVQVFTTGEEKFTALLRDIRAAKEYIHLLYFIFRTDELGAEILAALTKKAEQGVDVKVVYDSFGNLATSARGFQALRRAGGKVFRYSPLITSFISANYRNHRKLVIIDNKIGYIGGMNIGREYLGGKKKLRPWRDSHLKIEGSAVQLMELIFLEDYLYAVNRKDNIPDMRRFFNPVSVFTGKTTVQMLTSAPREGGDHIHAAYAKIINSAEHYIYIHTPYLVLDRTMLDCLRIAVTSGVDVRIMIPQIPDKYFVYFATLDCARGLCAMGAGIYLYKGFIHSKMIVADDQIVSIGSANMDIRSFFISYEANAVMFDQDLAVSQRDQFFADMGNCVRADKLYFSRISPFMKVMMPLGQLFSPLL